MNNRVTGIASVTEMRSSQECVLRIDVVTALSLSPLRPAPSTDTTPSGTSWFVSSYPTVNDEHLQTVSLGYLRSVEGL